MAEAFIVEAARTAVGKKNGVLSKLRADELAAHLLKGLVTRGNVDPNEVEDVIMGCVTQVGEQGLNVARVAALNAGFPIEVCGTSVNRMCGSSQQAVHFASMAVMSGQMEVAIGAGVESMSRISMGSDMFYNGEPAIPSEMMTERFTIIPQGNSAELICQKWGFSRSGIDEFALMSHQRALNAIDKGYFKKEIVPVQVKLEDGKVVTFDTDEGPRRDTSLERLGKLKPAFSDDGVITAGSSSQISDGAAGLILANEAGVRRLGLKPRARIVATAVAGVDPTIMLTGPIPATRKVLAKAGMKLSEIDLIEINEAFAPVVMATVQDLGMDMNKVNVNGGAIALGHPLGASGARLLTTLLHELERRNLRYGLSTMCIGFGQATATIIERV
ncbi:MAG: thiolase family protein [Myxococcota bacterium]